MPASALSLMRPHFWFSSGGLKNADEFLQATSVATKAYGENMNIPVSESVIFESVSNNVLDSGGKTQLFGKGGPETTTMTR